MAEPTEAAPTAELLVVGYPDVDAANKALEKLRQLDKDMSLKVRDAAVVVKSAEGDVKMLTPTHETSQGAVIGSLLGAAPLHTKCEHQPAKY